MKRFFIAVICLCMASCASVISRDLMDKGTKNPSLATISADPAAYRNKLFILGGIIVRTTLTPEGSRIEALDVPVDSYGYLENVRPSARRYIAVLPRNQGILDPEIYGRNKRVTIAGTFTGTETGKVGTMDYVFPVFTIEQIHLWKLERYMYNPWWGPYWDPRMYGPGWEHYWGPGPWW